MRKGTGVHYIKMNFISNFWKWGGSHEKKMKKGVDKFLIYGMLFSVMGLMKSLHIDWLDAQAMAAPVEGSHDGFRVDAREMDSSIPADAVEELCGWADERTVEAQDEMDGDDDYASPTDEDCGWFGYEGLCED